MTGYRHPNALLKEGVDHINISSQSTTRLGKLLDPSYFKSFNYPHLGKFNSVLNLWYWLKSSSMDDRLRKYTGVKLKNIVERRDIHLHVPNFKAIIAYATYLKLKDYPNTVSELRYLGDDLVFCSYYTPQGSMVRMCSNYAPVVVEIAQCVRKALILGDISCLDELTNGQVGGEYFYLEPFLESRLGKDKLVTCSISK